MPCNYNTAAENEYRTTKKRGKKRGSIKQQWINAVIAADSLSVHEKYALIVLSTWFDNRTLDCWPSQEAVSKKAKVRRERVKVATEKAEKLGLLYIGTNSEVPKRQRVHKQLKYYRATIPGILD